MSWGSIRGHDAVRDALANAARAGRFPHAFLFVGPEGIGKRTFALAMARALLCERGDPLGFDACGECPACLQVQVGTHPDLFQIAKPDDRAELPIAAMRELCRELGLKPLRGGRRVAIVDDADDLSTEAANAFLKTLEEPPPGAVLVLVGTSPERQLETIVSRCRVVSFQPLSPDDLAAVLVERGLVEDPARARALAEQAEGGVELATQLASEDFARFRRELLDILADPAHFDAPGLARRIQAFVQEAGKEAPPRRRRAILILGELARFFRGVLWQTAGAEPPSAESHDRAATAALAARLEPEDVFVLADRCLRAIDHVRRMSYLPTVLDALTADLGRALARP